MRERERLEQTIAHLEAQRATLGDVVVDASIAALREKLATLEAPPAAQASPLRAGGIRGGAKQQRKQVTVLLADVSSSTAIAETMDPEDVTEMMNALWERLDRVITEHGGTIDKHMGDAVLALWGAETAREDDPERAVRAALGIQAELGTFRVDQGIDLAMRIGINTGPALLGEVGTTGEYTAIGDTVNTASRLEGAAPVGGVLISHDTYRHVRGVFDVQPLVPIRVKGKAEPLQVYVVRRAKPRAFRMGRRGVEGIETRMIGREAELTLLQDAMYAAMDGARQVITITGEAGIGKSRLLYEFENWLELLPETIRYFKGRASPEMQNLPYALIRDLLSFRFQIQESDPSRVVRQKLEAGVGEVLDADQQGQMRAHVVGQLLGFDLSDSPHLQGVRDDAQQLRDRGLVYLSEFFQATTELAPTVIFVEDIHWADDSSLDATEYLARATADRRLLVLCLARPTLFERRAKWGAGQIFHTRMELRPLSEWDSHRLVEEILQKVEKVPLILRDLVVRGAEGNPFYVEELIKMLIEDEVIIKEEEHWRVEPARLTGVRVPPTLTGVLQARLDSLPLEERTVLQQASVVGRKFWDRAVAHIGTTAQERGGRGEISSTLSALQGKEMIFRRATSTFTNTQEYIFKHAILREVTYESVLKRVRRVYHRLIGEWLIQQSGERSGEYTGLIADHLQLAGETERAAIYLRRAGEQAAAQFANAEAVNYLSRALDLTPETDDAARYALLLAREKVYDVQGNREAQIRDMAALERLAGALDHDREGAQVALRRAHYSNTTGDYPAAIAAARTAIRLGQKAQDLKSEAAGYLGWGRALWYQGDNEAARSQLEHALALAQSAGFRQLEADILRNVGAVAYRLSDYDGARDAWQQALFTYREIGDRRGESATLNNLGVVCWSQGDHAGARAYYEQALLMFRDIGYREGEGNALSNLGLISADHGDHAGARSYLKQALLVCREIGDRQVEGWGLINLGRVSSSLGDYSQATAYLKQALRLCREIGNRRGEGLALSNLGVVLLQQGDHARARSYLEQALRLCREIGDRQAEGWGLTNLGALSADQGSYAEAQACYEQALQIYREIGDRKSAGRGLADLGLLFHHLGDDEAAREYSHQALAIAQDLDDRPTQGYALTNLGHALVGLAQRSTQAQERLAEATTAYRQALNLRRELGQTNLAMEPLAGLACVSLTQGDLSRAQAQVDEILSHLRIHNLHGTEEPFRVYLTCYRVLRANQDPRWEEFLDRAHRLLQEYAASIDDEDRRRSYLENVATHRAIVAAWEGR